MDEPFGSMNYENPMEDEDTLSSLFKSLCYLTTFRPNEAIARTLNYALGAVDDLSASVESKKCFCDFARMFADQIVNYSNMQERGKVVAQFVVFGSLNRPEQLAALEERLAQFPISSPRPIGWFVRDMSPKRQEELLACLPR